MRHRLIRAWTTLALLMAAEHALAIAPVTAATGASREVRQRKLQQQLDNLLGAGHMHAGTDWIGAHPGDPDPWSWVNHGVRPIAVTLIDRESPRGVVGWYEETGSVPVLDGVGDGVVLDGLRVRGARAVVRLPGSVKRFGFYITRARHDAGKHHGPSAVYFTNHRLNDPGLHGHEDGRETSDGNFRLLVFDVSRWLGAGTCLVACHVPGGGRHAGHAEEADDDDDDDSDDDEGTFTLFMVAGSGGTPAHSMSFARVKALYR